MKNIFISSFFVLSLIGCDPNNQPQNTNNSSTIDASVVDASSSDACAVESGTSHVVCSNNCGTFSGDFGCGLMSYDCPRACTISHTCHETKHICCVEIKDKLDLFCRYFPYYNSTFSGAGNTPSNSSATRIPSPEEVGFTYCDYPGYVNCSHY